jgi:hypothetical protein
MSFNFQFHAATKAAAKREVNNNHAPDYIKAMLNDAIDNLPDNLTGHRGEQSKIVHVKAVGHMADAKNQSQSNCNVEVGWEFVYQDVGDLAHGGPVAGVNGDAT